MIYYPIDQQQCPHQSSLFFLSSDSNYGEGYCIHCKTDVHDVFKEAYYQFIIIYFLITFLIFFIFLHSYHILFTISITFFSSSLSSFYAETDFKNKQVFFIWYFPFKYDIIDPNWSRLNTCKIYLRSKVITYMIAKIWVVTHTLVHI